MRPATEIVTAELPLAHIVELPARGVGADLIGRAAALLVDIAIDVVPTGYRTTARPGAVVRRARGFLDEDVDALEEEWERGGHRGSDRAVKVQAPGPVTLAAQLELPNGHRAITDPGAVRDLAASLAEGLAIHQANLSRRLGARIVKVAPCSMVIAGSLAEWRSWTGLAFDRDGEMLLAGALSPVQVSLAQDYAVYVEPNVWMEHRL